MTRRRKDADRNVTPLEIALVAIGAGILLTPMVASALWPDSVFVNRLLKVLDWLSTLWFSSAE